MSSKRKIDINKIVTECRRVAEEHIRKWKPENPDLPTINGAAYLRLSTDEQVAVEKGSLEQQVYLAIAECETRSKQNKVNYRIIDFYIEPGISGQKDNRKEFTALKRNISRGIYQFVVFKEIARIARDGLIWKQFFNLCHEKKCEILVRGLPINPNDPASVLQLDILSAFSEYEAKNTSKRIRDSVSSAMINNGKFNSTHQVLGLDPIESDGSKKVGFYKPNADELKTVTWIMNTFLKYGAHNKTLEECTKKGVLNKNGQPFRRHSLITLLTNPKYIGKWYRNEDSKSKPQDRLTPHEQYHEITLPHGAVIALDLWSQVQKRIAELARSSGKHKNGDNRVYPLSGGLLRYEDGTHFKGYCGNGLTQTSFYYRNVQNKINIKAPLIEQDAVKTVAAIVAKGKEYQDAIKRFGADVADHLQFLEAQLAKLESQLNQTQQEKREYLENLRTLLKSCGGADEIAAIKDGFKDHLEQVSGKQQELEQQIIKLKKDLTQARSTNFSWARIGEQAEKIMGIIAEHDPLALKSAYHALFDAVVVGAENKDGVRSISYVLDHEEWNPHGPRSTLVEPVGIEPTSEKDPPPQSTCLVTAFD